MKQEGNPENQGEERQGNWEKVTKGGSHFLGKAPDCVSNPLGISMTMQVLFLKLLIGNPETSQN